jgi:hypothetical protein
MTVFSCQKYVSPFWSMKSIFHCLVGKFPSIFLVSKNHQIFHWYRIIKHPNFIPKIGSK